MEKIERTVEQQIAADRADFDRVAAELIKNGFVEEFKRNWGIPIGSSVDDNGTNSGIISSGGCGNGDNKNCSS